MTTSPRFDRRHLLRLAGGTGALVLVGCASESAPGAASTSSPSVPATSATPTSSAPATTTSTTSAAECTTLPSETAGPYPGDGTNGPDVLVEDGVVRPDLRSSVGSAHGTATGVQLDVELTLLDTSAACAPLAGAAVYLWHADGEGRYSMYSQGVTDQNYLRGVQAAGTDGVVRFVTVFPGCYRGRWPHLHFAVYANTDDATSGARPLLTSQVAMPAEACASVYATPDYASSVDPFAGVSLASDNVFGDDGGRRQLATVTGSIGGTGADTLTARLTVPV